MFNNYIPYYKSNLRLAIPVIIAQVGQYSVQIVDTIMVGNLGSAVPLAAVSFAYSLSIPILMFGTGAAMGLTPLVGRAYARNDSHRISSLFQNSILMCVIVALLMALMLFGAIEVMGYMGQDPQILPIARQFLYFQIGSTLPMMLYASGKQLLEGVGNTRHAMNITITGNVLNVALNYALIYGWWIFPEMGAVGAGASTFISRLVMLALFIKLFAVSGEYKQYVVQFCRKNFSKFRLRRLVNIGFPIAMQLSIELTALSLMAVAIGLFGPAALAAHQIAVNLPSLSFMVITGLAAATTIKVSQDYGLRLYNSIRLTMNASVHMIILFTVFASLVVILFGRPIAALFSPEEEVVSIATYLLLFGGAFMVIDGVQGVILGALRGMTQVKKPMYYAIVVYILISLPVGYVCSFVLNWGVAGPWIAFTVGLFCLAGLYYRLFRRTLRSLQASKTVE